MSDLHKTESRPGRPSSDGQGESHMIGAMNDNATGTLETRSRGSRRSADLIFQGISTGSGIFVVLAIVLIGVFLLIQSVPSLAANNANFLFSAQFSTTDAGNLRFGIRDLLLVTVLSSAFALVIAMPIALGIALFLTQYAPTTLRRPFAYLIDVLAAVPSIVYGLWGLAVLGPALVPVAEWLNATFGWFPLFANGNVSIGGGGTIFTAGIVLAVMILPIITSITREVFRQTPADHIEGALALGATKWEMIRATVLPYGRSGYIGASMLGLGRALGETVAVLIILRTSTDPTTFSLFDGGYTFASKIASAAAEFNQPLPTGAYIAAGLVLFVLTFVVNAIARSIVGGKVNR
ncbi:MAG: phosphate ABC transporter permease subunit PstC [Pseudonocardiaceae bacterium]|nr:phosphate ABC transporter permease subunit PstC [Pseudonocardiaceae bacterium]